MTTNEQWPPANKGPTTQHVPRESAILRISGRTTIQAPAAEVFNKILRVGDYSTWNTFTPEGEIISHPSSSNDNPQPDQGEHGNSETLQLGSRFIIHAVMAPGKAPAPNQCRVVDVSTPEQPSSYVPSTTLETDGTYCSDLSRVYRAAWQVEGGWIAKGLKSERFVEVIVRGERECEARTWELMGGLLARVVKAMYQKALDTAFENWCRDLKEVCEKDDKERLQETAA